MTAQNWQLLRQAGDDASDTLIRMLQELDAQVQEGGGSQPSGQALYGDGSDGNVTVDSDVFDFPAFAGVADWQDATEYAPGDLVKSTGSNPRVYECVLAGTSGASEPFLDDPPGCQRRGDRRVEDSSGLTMGTPVWEQETAVCQGQMEGPLFADDLTVEAGNMMKVHGWPIYATGTATIEATASLSADGVDAVGSTPGSYESGFLDVCTLLGRGADGSTADLPGSPAQLWGGGVGGFGGVGADISESSQLAPGVTTDLTAIGYTKSRQTLQMIFASFFWNLNSLADGPPQIGAPGGGGSSDTGNGKSGGASGACASAGAIFARTLVLAGSLTAVGGAGGDGEAGGDTGGGGGSSGGCWVLAYDTKTGAGTIDVDGGAGGSGQGAGSDGGDAGPGEIVEYVNA